MDPTGVIFEEILNQNFLWPDESVEPKKSADEKASPGGEQQASSSVTAPSSPVREERMLFSSDVLDDEESELSSPPSSVPSRMPSPIAPARKTTFSFLKRKRSTFDDGSEPTPLTDIEPNARRGPRPRAIKKPMTQMQIDLGGDVRKTCRTCGMEYIPSVREDATLHKEFCGINIGGIEMSKAFLQDESLRRVNSERANRREKEEVVMVDRRSSQAVRNKVQRVLEAVNIELSAAEIGDDALWQPLKAETTEKQPTSKRKGAHQDPGTGDRFKAFLYMVGDRCIGFCLVEKIGIAFPVVNPKPELRDDGEVMAASKSSSISVSTAAHVALLGISRIWTSKSFRNRGLAIDLLECARRNFFYGVEIPKNLAAFSQPSESGGRLAERWFGAQTGWHVYRGDQQSP